MAKPIRINRRAAVVAAIVLLVSVTGWVVTAIWYFGSFEQDRIVERRVAELRQKIADGTFTGMTVEEVTRTLGTDQRPSEMRDWDIGFRIGACMIDVYWLVLRVDDGRVAEAAVISD